MDSRTQVFYLFVEDDCSSEVDWHERGLGHEEVVQPDHVRVVRQDMAEPGRKVTSTERFTDLGKLKLQMVVWFQA